MSPGVLKGIGIGCFVLCAILLFVAWERYQDNASKVEAANKMLHSSPFGGMMQGMTGSPQLEPSTPAATKYAIIFAVLSGVGGVACFVIGAKKGPGTAPPGATPSA